MPAAAAAISRLVSELTEQKVRHLLVELLTANPGTTQTPAEPKPARIRTRTAAKPTTAIRSRQAKAKRVIDPDGPARSAATRSSKRKEAREAKAAAAKASKSDPAKAAPTAATTAEPTPAKQRDRRLGSKWASGRERQPASKANGKSDEAWKAAAKRAVSAIPKPAAATP
jgi:hypothetical protein